MRFLASTFSSSGFVRSSPALTNPCTLANLRATAASSVVDMQPTSVPPCAMNSSETAMSSGLTDILGADNLSCWGLIDQLIFMENAVTT